MGAVTTSTDPTVLPTTADDWTAFFDDGQVFGRDVFRVVGDDLDPDFIFDVVTMSLFSDARAAEDDPLPFAGASRRGWWGAAVATTTGEGWGSRLWLLDTAPATNESLLAAKGYVEDALAWLRRDGIVEAVEVSAELAGEDLVIGIQLRRGASTADFRFADLWGAHAA